METLSLFIRIKTPVLERLYDTLPVDADAGFHKTIKDMSHDELFRLINPVIHRSLLTHASPLMKFSEIRSMTAGAHDPKTFAYILQKARQAQFDAMRQVANELDSLPKSFEIHNRPALRHMLCGDCEKLFPGDTLACIQDRSDRYTMKFSSNIPLACLREMEEDPDCWAAMLIPYQSM